MSPISFRTVISSAVTARDRLEAMAIGRARLRRLTGQDFGYDLKDWHEHLLDAEEGAYQHPYAWSSVKEAVKKALDDQDSLRLVEKLGRPLERLSSEMLAVLIVDALVDAGLVKEDEFRKAVDLTRGEIEVRKALGDY